MPKPRKAPLAIHPKVWSTGPHVKNYLVRRSQFPLADLHVMFDIGRAADPVGKEGLADVCMNLLEEGTAGLGGAAFRREKAKLGLRIGAFASPYTSTVHVSFLTDHAASALALVRRVLARPRLVTDEHNALVNRRADEHVRGSRTPFGRAYQLEPLLILGAEDPQGRVPTPTRL